MDKIFEKVTPTTISFSSPLRADSQIWIDDNHQRQCGFDEAIEIFKQQQVTGEKKVFSVFFCYELTTCIFSADEYLVSLETANAVNRGVLPIKVEDISEDEEEEDIVMQDKSVADDNVSPAHAAAANVPVLEQVAAAVDDIVQLDPVEVVDIEGDEEFVAPVQQPQPAVIVDDAIQPDPVEVVAPVQLPQPPANDVWTVDAVNV